MTRGYSFSARLLPCASGAEVATARAVLCSDREEVLRAGWKQAHMGMKFFLFMGHVIPSFLYVALICLDVPLIVWVFHKMFGSWSDFVEAFCQSAMARNTWFGDPELYNREVAGFLVEGFFVFLIALFIGEYVLLFGNHVH